MNLHEAHEKYNAVVSFVEHETSNPRGKIAGWDIALKDNFNMIGTLTTASCRLLENHHAIYNAEVVNRLQKEGARIVAKTSMDELGMGGTNLSAITGPVFNPYDTTRISGGSSGGSAVLVASKTVRAALGSDTGDSVRKPAAFCGAVGVKPTYGRISRYGVIPYASSLDHVGYFTQNIEDAAIMLEVLAGRDDHDMTSSFAPVDAYSQHLDMDLKGKRIGFFKSVNDTFTNAEATEALQVFKLQLEKQGAVIVDKTMDPMLLRSVLAVYYMISNSEAVANHADLDGVRYGVSKPGETLEDVMTQTRSQGFSTMIKKRFIYGAFALNDDNQEEVLNKAKKVRRLLVETYERFFDDVDVVVALASGSAAPKLEDVGKGDSLSDEQLIGENHMVINNFSGYPSLSMPLGWVDGMPLGVNVSAKPFAEKTLFAYAKQFETLIAWKGAF